MTRVIPALLLALALAPACGNRAPAPAAPAIAATPTPEEVVAAGKGLVEEYRQAYEVRSVDALSGLYAHTLDVVLVHQGNERAGWTDVRSYLKELLEHATEIHLTLSDVAVTALGDDAATAVASVRREVSDGTTTVTTEGVLTLALRRTGSKWRIATEHYSYRTQ